MLHQSLGLLGGRRKNPGSALVSLKRAAELDQANANYAFAYALALHVDGRTGEARAVADEALKKTPGAYYLREFLAHTENQVNTE
ncbi:MAG: hypothetical protein ACU833_00110 [Gammaproteobacteria bacterium]